MSSPAATDAERHWKYFALIVLALLTFVVFVQVIRFEFVNFDDQGYRTDNPRVAAGLSRENVVWACKTTYLSNWHPLTWLSLMLDAQIYGDNAGGFHLTNLILHTANVLLLFGLLFRMTHSIWSSVVVAALFAIHPLHVESVAWMSERKGLLSTLFGLLAIAAYVRYVHNFRRTYYVLAMVAYVLSLMSKQMLVTLPFLLLLIDYWPLQRTGVSPGWVLLEKIPFLVITIIFCGVAFIVQSQAGSTSMIEVSLISRCFNAILVYALYLIKTVWPMNLSVFYPHPGDEISLVAVAAAASCLIAISAVVVAQHRSRPYLLMGWLWYLGTLVPVIGIVQVGRQQMADRYTYVPLIGIFIAVCWLVPSVVSSSAWRKTILPGLTSLLVVVLAIVSWRQVDYWRNSIALFDHALVVTGDNALAHEQMGIALVQLERYDEAIGHYRAALRIKPKIARTHFNLGYAIFRQNRLDKAIQHYQEAIRIDPRYTRALTNLGIVLANLQRYDEAILRFREAITIDSKLVEPWYSLGRTMEKVGRESEAIGYYRAVLEIDGNYAPAHHRLGYLLSRMSQYDEAIQHYQKAIRIDPEFTAAHLGIERVRRKTSTK